MKSFQRASIILGNIAFLTLMGSLSFAEDLDDRVSLRGLQGVRIVVEDVAPQIVKDGLAKDQLYTDVELKLLMAGIKVLTEAEARMEKGRPWLYVNAAIMKTDSESYIYTIFIEFNQDVRLVRAPNVEVSTGTWKVVHTGMAHEISQIRERVKMHVDEFVNAYLSVNPKQEQLQPE